MYKIKYDSPTLGKGEVVTVTGLGELINGKFVEFPDNANETFKAANGVVDIDEEGNAFFVSGLSLKEAFKADKSFTVEFEKDTPAVIPTPTPNGGANA